MQIDVITLFPEVITNSLHSIVKRAIDQDILKLRAINLRDFSKDKYRSVDDHPYGGGLGMIIKCQPVFDAVASLKPGRVILLDPVGIKYSQKEAKRLSKYKHLILISGHYEGVDQRIKDHLADEIISVGDYILTGGEIPALAIIDSVTRLLPGVLKKEATEKESFSPLLEYPQYTRPEKFNNLLVPKVLLSGNHEKIEIWKKKQSKILTQKKRADLIKT